MPILISTSSTCRGRRTIASPLAITIRSSAAWAKSWALCCTDCGRSTSGLSPALFHVKLPAEVKAKFPNLYPSDNLYTHEWDTHGTCSGLTPEGYLALSKKLKDSVVVPAPYKAPEQPVRVTTAKFKQEFVSANPAMTADSLAVYCSGSGRFLQELYVCFSQAGQPISCSREIRDKGAKSCGNPDFLVRNVR